MTAVTSKGQVTIPKPIRDALNIGPGSLVEFVMDPDGRVVLRRADAEKPATPCFDRVVGSLGSEMTTDEIMAFIRGED
jgi:antitoxin PrlF